MILKLFPAELKGDIEELDVDDEIKLATLSIIPVYNLLSRVGSWVDIGTLGVHDYLPVCGWDMSGI